ncbi:MAG: glycoside hydrolase family 130 protein [Candidatus Hydrogenedentes bacterium]|nr:glycoside hydrolase family 130 protein [Candidatus Hydrogenedentota bacterium]
MLKRLFCQCLCRPEDLKPSHEGLEVVSAFNPGAVRFNGGVVLLVRVAERPIERRPGYVASPRYAADGGYLIDWLREDEVIVHDPRAVTLKSSNSIRLTFMSHFRVLYSGDGRSIDSVGGAFLPEAAEEAFGVEDPRITRLDDTYYFTYVAVSRHGAATALASTRDFRTFQRHGIIFTCENKDVLLFPEQIDGQFVAYHRPNPCYHFGPPEMWIAYSSDLLHWGRHAPLLTGASDWEAGRIGGGIPPFRTPRGWLEIYHGNAVGTLQDPVGTYVAAAFLTPPDEPDHIIAATRMPIMAPERDFETTGFLDDVIFPTGCVQRDDVLQVFYGAADANTGVVEFSLSELMEQLQPLGLQKRAPVQPEVALTLEP